MKRARDVVWDERLVNHAALVATGLLCAVMLWRATLANVDLAGGRFELHMDERVTYDGVHAILHPTSIKRWLSSIVRGDQRYGRILWYTTAAIAWGPERIGGPTGQIIATRTYELVLTISSALIFAFGLVRSAYLRLILLLGLLTVPYADYYMTMPKPEPLQLLLLALFSAWFVRKRGAPGWYWLFMGMALGCKISALPAVAAFGIGMLVMLLGEGRRPSIEELVTTASVFLIGMAIAVPLLLPPVILFTGGIWIGLVIQRRWPGHVCAWGLPVLTTLASVAVGKGPLRTWGEATFLNTKHGEDRASITALDWLGYVWSDWFVAPGFIGMAMVCCAVGYVGLVLLLRLRRGRGAFLAVVPTATVMMAGVLLDIAIICGVKRLWGFYLYPGTILALTGLFAMIDGENEGRTRAPGTESLLARSLGQTLVVLVCGVAAVYWAPRTLRNLATLAQRTKVETYTVERESYDTMKRILDGLGPLPGGERRRVVCSPSHFFPDDAPAYDVAEFWGPYDWSASADVVILSKGNIAGESGYPRDSPEYARSLEERAGYAAHVAAPGQPCGVPPCFEVTAELANGGQVLVRRE